MNLPNAVTTCFRKYWNTDGRASRSEYWYWNLFTTLASLALMLPDYYMFDDADNGPLGILFTAITFLPSLFVLVRRLHDVNRSGHWWLISITVIGLIPVLYWTIKKGTHGENDYGEPVVA